MPHSGSASTHGAAACVPRVRARCELLSGCRGMGLVGNPGWSGWTGGTGQAVGGDAWVLVGTPPVRRQRDEMHMHMQGQAHAAGSLAASFRHHAGHCLPPRTCTQGLGAISMLAATCPAVGGPG